MKKGFLCMLAMQFLALTCSLLVLSCGNDNDTDDENSNYGSESIDVTKLLGYTFYQNEKGIENDYYREIFIKTPVFATVYTYGRDLTDEGWKSWDHGKVDCIYKIVGNKLTVFYDDSRGLVKEYVINFVNGEPIDWRRGDENAYAILPDGFDRSMFPYIFEAFDAQEGSPSIYGFYRYDKLEELLGANFRSMEAAGDSGFERFNSYVKSENAMLSSSSVGYLITDGNTIHSVYGGATLDSGKINGKVFMKESYYIGNKTYTVYYYYKTDYFAKSYKYVMDGDILVMSSGGIIVVRGGKLFPASYDENGKCIISTNSAYTKQ